MNESPAFPHPPYWPLAAAGLLGLAAVALGAAGTHALEPKLDAESYARFATALDYHRYHALALLALGLAAHTGRERLYRPIRRAALCFVLGIVLFSGSLYLHALAGIALPYVAPAGGFVLMFGWLSLMCRCWHR